MTLGGICVLRHITAALPRRKGSWYSLNRMRDVTHRLGRRFGKDKIFLSLQGFRFRSLGRSSRRPATVLTELPRFVTNSILRFNPLNAKLNPICYLLALLAHHFLHVSSVRVKSLTLRLLMSYIYIYGAPILDVSRSHTTTQHSR